MKNTEEQTDNDKQRPVPKGHGKLFYLRALFAGPINGRPGHILAVSFSLAATRSTLASLISSSVTLQLSFDPGDIKPIPATCL